MQLTEQCAGALREGPLQVNTGPFLGAVFPFGEHVAVGCYLTSLYFIPFGPLAGRLHEARALGRFCAALLSS